MKQIQTKQTFDKKDTQIVKGVAILLLLFYHLFESQELLVSMGVNHSPFSQETFLMLSGFGNICVAVFAFLSAYGITKGLMARESAGDVSYPEMLKEACWRCLRLIGNFAIMYISVNLLWFSRFDYVKLYGEGWQGGMFALMDMLGLAQLLDTPTLNMTWWYMELAILIIFLIPVIYPLVRKAGRYLLVPALLLPTVFQMGEDTERYYFVILFGAVAAHEGWFEKLFSGKVKTVWKLVAGAVLLLLSVLIRQNYMVHTYFLWILDAPVALLVSWFVAEFLTRIPGISHVLGFLGKHSMNIFFVHTFFYMSLFRGFIYSFRYAGVIFLVLVGVSLGYSVVLELVKTGGKMGYGKIKSKLGSRDKTTDKMN